MNILKCLSVLAMFFCFAGSSLHAQIPPAEQLLPDDTIAVATVPDWKKLAGDVGKSPWGQLWADSAVKAFRDNFTSNFLADFVKPLEKQLGIRLTDYQELLQGQITLALMPPAEGASYFTGFLLLVDTKDKADALATKLSELKKKLTDSGKDVRSEKIREVDFQAISIGGADIKMLLKKAFPGEPQDKEAEEKKDAEKTTLRIGQFKSLLIIGQNEKAIEKLLARQSGGLVPPLGDKASYQKIHSQMFRSSLAHVWINAKPIYEKVLQNMGQQPESVPGMPAMNFSKILPALGLNSLESIAAKIGAAPDGCSFDFLIGVPEGQREGIFKLMTLEKKDAAPPAFVPADTIKFQRTRLDAQKAWTTLEAVISRIDPSLAGLVNLMLSSAGKDQDPNFDLKKNLIGNLGDDFIIYQKLPKAPNPAALQSPPSLILIGSPNPAQLLDAMRMVTSLLPPPISSAPLKEREFLGKKIYSLSMAAPASVPPGTDEKEPVPQTQSFNFTSSAGYVAFSADNSILEEYLRSAENPPKPLRAVPGLAEAVQKIGGMESGYFSYENQAESLRAVMDVLKGDPEGFSRMLFFSLSGGDDEGKNVFNRLFDFKLLPSFDRISKYFHIAVASAGATPEGFVIRAFTPTPPGMQN